MHLSSSEKVGPTDVEAVDVRREDGEEKQYTIHDHIHGRTCDHKDCKWREEDVDHGEAEPLSYGLQHVAIDRSAHESAPSTQECCSRR